MTERPTQFQWIAVDNLRRGQYQPRQQFDEQSLQELSDSIKTQGLIEPLVVRAIGVDSYEIIAGERRWRAAKMAGMQEVPCVIGDYTDAETAAITLIENIQREDLNLMEEAEGFQRLVLEFHYQQDEIATLVGKSRSHIANILRLLTLSLPVQEKIRQRQLSLGHARMLVGLSDASQQYFLTQIETKQLSVRQLEQAIKLHKNQPDSNPTDNALMHLEMTLSEQVGAPVKIQTEEGQSGWFKVKFYDNETLEGLLERLGLRYD